MSDKPAKPRKPLSGGFILAYTPGSHNQTEPGVYRLTLSRRGTWQRPSDQGLISWRSGRDQVGGPSSSADAT